MFLRSVGGAEFRITQTPSTLAKDRWEIGMKRGSSLDSAIGREVVAQSERGLLGDTSFWPGPGPGHSYFNS